MKVSLTGERKRSHRLPYLKVGVEVEALVDRVLSIGVACGKAAVEELEAPLGAAAVVMDEAGHVLCVPPTHPPTE